MLRFHSGCCSLFLNTGLKFVAIVIIIFNTSQPFHISLTDINECQRPYSHKCEQICLNNDGGYSCKCRQGYVLAQDGYGCDGRQ